MNNTFVPSTKPFIKATLAKNKTRVLVFLLFYETINNPNKDLKLVSGVIYTIISNYVLIIQLVNQKMSEIPVGTGGVFQ